MASLAPAPAPVILLAQPIVQETYGVLTFTGSDAAGYVAMLRGDAVLVVRVGDMGWEGFYSGDPSVHNKSEPSPVDGRMRKSCACPIVSAGVQRTRVAAALTALAAYARERRNS